MCLFIPVTLSIAVICSHYFFHGLDQYQRVKLYLPEININREIVESQVVHTIYIG